MDPFTFFTTLTLLCISYVFLGFYTRHRTQDREEFLLSSRGLGGITLATSIIATQLGGGTLMGAAQEAYFSRWYVLFYPLGSCLGLITLSWGFGARWRELKLATISELFERVYRSTALRQLSAILSIVSLLLLLIGQGVAARQFLATLGYNTPWVFWSFWLVLITYTVLGGLSAVVNTDILQTVFILGALLLSCLYIFIHSPDALSSTLNVETSGKTLATIPWIDWMLLPFLFMMIEQDMGQRCFAAKSPKTVTYATLTAALTMMLACALPIWIGALGNKMGVDIRDGKSVLIETIRFMTNPKITAVFACAILMAIISTADSLLCSITSNLSFDFASFGRDEKTKVKWAQLLTLFVGLLAMFLSTFFSNVISVLMLAYELSVCLLFVPIVVATFCDKLPAKAAWSSIILSSIGFIVHNLFFSHIPSVVICLPLSTVAMFWGLRRKL